MSASFEERLGMNAKSDPHELFVVGVGGGGFPHRPFQTLQSCVYVLWSCPCDLRPPKFIHLTYKPEGEVTKKIGIVGKGLTFDSGGYTMKVLRGVKRAVFRCLNQSEVIQEQFDLRAGKKWKSRRQTLPIQKPLSRSAYKSRADIKGVMKKRRDS